MISRSVVWGCLVSLLVRVGQPIQYTPLDHLDAPAVGPGDCALILGNDRTSLYDYGTNLLRGTLDFGGSPPCITYDAVNQAYIEARKRIHIKVPPVERMWKTDEIAKVGELLLDISAQLTKTYGLTVEEVESGLPQIDTSKTLIQEVCPPFLSNVECHAGKYRRLDGLCNNINNPSWGATMTPFTRLIPPQFADGLNAPRQSVLGHALPLPRVVSRTMHPDEGFHDHAGTVMVVAWGQFMDHDFTLTATPLDPVNKNDPEECCDRPPHQKHPYCLEIIVPDDDYFYKGYKVKCMDFVRSFPSVRPGCRLGSKVPYNTLTGVIDGNTVYGVDDQFGRHLRSGYGGELRMNPVFGEYGLKDLLPLKLDVPDEGCTRTNNSQYCFEAGEIRVNEQLVLTCMHTMMAREHNRVARGLAEVNPHWDDETLYQEARRIVIAEIQHITYNEFLPIILGKDVMDKFGLMLQKEGYWDGYDPTVNPNIIAAFSAAAFRFGHSLLPTAVERWSKAHKFISSKRLSDLIRRPYDLYRAGVLDEYLMGLMNQVAQAMDDSITQEVTNHLLKKPGSRFGLDLVAFNMQRGREFGVPGYMQYRKFCGLPTAESFEELFGSMPNSTVYRYASIFDHPNDIDLWSGGVSERPLPGSMIGPTFACVIATQLSFIRRGDRFWYELPNQPSSFTPEQLQELRKIKLSRILCDNTDLLDTVQIYPMVLPDHEINPRVPCKAGIIPSIDLTKWAEFPNPAHYNLSQHSQPPSAEEIVVICNGTAGCSVPERGQKNINNFIRIEGDKQSNKIIDIVAESPVLYIQRLKRWFQEHGILGNQTFRTKRTERSAFIKVPNSHVDSSGRRFVKEENLGHLYLSRKPDIHEDMKIRPEPKYSHNREIIFHPGSEGRTSEGLNSSRLQRNGRKKVRKPVLNDPFNVSNETLKNFNYPKTSRSDIDLGESQFDHSQTTRNERIRPDQTLFIKRKYPQSERRFGDSGFNQQLLLGGTVRDYSTGGHDDPTPFPILDVDHDYDGQFEFVKLNKEVTDESEEEGEIRDESRGSDESRQSYEDEGSRGDSEEESIPDGGEDETEGERENTEDDDVEVSKVIVFTPTNGNSQQNNQFGLSPEDIQARYITKDPLAGPGATRGFNHDFKAMRGVPLQGGGGVAILPNNRYPTIPGFNTKQIHNILTSGKLPGNPGVGPNGTTVGIIPIEPARHARPNNLGQYLEEIHPPPLSPGKGLYTRRPIGRIRIKSQSYNGRGVKRPLYSLGSIRGQNVVLMKRPLRYRQPVRGGTRLSYPGRGNPANLYRSRSSGQPILRVNILENRMFKNEPVKHDENYEDDIGMSKDSNYKKSENNDKFIKDPPEKFNTEETLEPDDSSGDHDKREEPKVTVSDEDTSNIFPSEEELREEIKPSSDLNYRSNKEYPRSKHEEELTDGSNEQIRIENTREYNEREGGKEDGGITEDVADSVGSKQKETVEDRRASNDQDDLPKTIAKILQRTKDIEDDKMTPDGQEPVAYNKYWSLEYSYPT